MTRCPSSGQVVRQDWILFSGGHAVCPDCGRTIAVRFPSRMVQPMGRFYDHNTRETK